MSYQRPPMYHHHHQQQQQSHQQQQALQQHHYQPRLQHAPNAFPPPPPQHRLQYDFAQNHSVSSPLNYMNQGYGQQVGSAPTVAASNAMLDDYNDRAIVKQEFSQQNEELNASRIFPEETYYCQNNNRPLTAAYRVPIVSQKVTAFYQAHDQPADIAAERQLQHQQLNYEADFDAADDDVGAMPSQAYTHEPERSYEHHHNHPQHQQMQHYDSMPTGAHSQHPTQNLQNPPQHHLQSHQMRYSERQILADKIPAEVDPSAMIPQQNRHQQQHQHSPFGSAAAEVYPGHPQQFLYGGEFSQPPPPTNEDHVARQYLPRSLSAHQHHQASRRYADRFHNHHHPQQQHRQHRTYQRPHSVGDTMDTTQEGGQFSASTDTGSSSTRIGIGGAQPLCQAVPDDSIHVHHHQQQQRHQHHHHHQHHHEHSVDPLYTVQEGQLVRQEMSVNPRKISRVSLSEITSPSIRQQQQQHHHLNHYQSGRQSLGSLNHHQYPSSADTCRVVSSSPDDNNADEQLPHQTYSHTPFVESVSSDQQTEDYSSYDDSPAAPATPVTVQQPHQQNRNHHHHQHQQQQQQQLQRSPQKLSDKQQQQQSNYIDMRSSGTVSQDWLDMICRHMIEHMNNFGICVIDNFLGSLKGEAILSEVMKLYSRRSYTTGRLVSDKRSDENENATGLDGGPEAQVQKSQQQQQSAVVDPARTIRSDRVIWVDGCEDGCSEINNLIQTLCSVITNSSRLSLYSGNALDKIVINKRTKAHVACYPGNRTRYIKHVDNPNNDGRVITAIYYLNKNWDTKQDGGLLRMFPAGMDTVANIEPFFDRVLFFWSDRRNPHEVLPAFRDRFAITVWYIGNETSRNQ